MQNRIPNDEQSGEGLITPLQVKINDCEQALGLLYNTLNSVEGRIKKEEKEEDDKKKQIKENELGKFSTFLTASLSHLHSLSTSANTRTDASHGSWLYKNISNIIKVADELHLKILKAVPNNYLDENQYQETYKKVVVSINEQIIRLGNLKKTLQHIEKSAELEKYVQEDKIRKEKSRVIPSEDDYKKSSKNIKKLSSSRWSPCCPSWCTIL